MLLLALACTDAPAPDSGDSTPPEDTGEPCVESDWFADADEDGFGALESVSACEQPDGHIAVSGDCDDSSAEVHPDAVETCNHVDDDCDGTVDLDGWIPGDFDSFSHAVEVAPDDAHICVDTGDFPASALTLDRAMHFHGSGPSTVLDAGGSWMFRAMESTDFTLEDATVVNLLATSTGGLVQARGEADLTLRRLGVDGLTSSSTNAVGGLVYADGGTAVTVQDVRLSDIALEADAVYGLAIYVSTGSLELDGLEVLGGTVSGDFIGTLYVGNPSTIEVRDLTVAELDITPEYTHYGLGLYMAGEPHIAEIDGLTIRDNTVAYTGPAHIQGYGAFGAYIENYGDGPVDIRHLYVVDNTLTADGETRLQGGVIFSGYGDHTVTNALVADNTFDVDSGYTQARPARSASSPCPGNCSPSSTSTAASRSSTSARCEPWRASTAAATASRSSATRCAWPGAMCATSASPTWTTPTSMDSMRGCPRSPFRTGSWPSPWAAARSTGSSWRPASSEPAGSGRIGSRRMSPGVPTAHSSQRPSLEASSG